MSVKFATSGMVNGARVEAEVAARAVAAVVLDSLEVHRVEAGAGARRELHRVDADEELHAARPAFGHVEHVVGRLERDEVIEVEAAAEELVRVIEPSSASRYDARVPEPIAAEGEGVELLILERREAGELDAHVLQRARVVRRDVAAVVQHRVVLAADHGVAVRARALDVDGAGLRLFGALPTRSNPPQSPGWRWPAARDDVNTIGASAVPTAWIFAPA